MEYFYTVFLLLCKSRGEFNEHRSFCVGRLFCLAMIKKDICFKIQQFIKC